MENRTPGPARALATIALVVGFVALVVVVSTSLGGGSGGGGNSSGGHGRVARRAPGGGEAKRPVPATYVVKSGDTLISIGHRTGVPVARIERLNPETDPQILIAGEKLKLR